MTKIHRLPSYLRYEKVITAKHEKIYYAVLEIDGRETRMGLPFKRAGDAEKAGKAEAQRMRDEAVANMVKEK